ncbi:MAG: response regulator transcription factor [Bacteroidia bacterium]|nr:response regulator transcription factor [Bacteroidia bacterium]MBP9688975.1 response regulator transcription factor [Bacteroidia bacterium]
MKILVIEDEPKVASFIKQGLEEQSNNVTIAYDGFFGHKLATENEFDVIVLDLMIPYMNGLDLCRKLREEGVKTPILMLTALGTTDDKVTGLEIGADDYMVKPFEFKELVARIRALSKRFTDTIQLPKVLKVADLEMNLDEKSVRRSGKSIDLTAKEFSLLEFLLRNKNRVVSRTEISEKVWDIHFDTGTNVIDVYVNFLRKKVDKEFDKKLIQTMVGMGYVIKSDE